MPPPTGREGSLFSEDDSKREKEKMKAGQGELGEEDELLVN